MTARATNGPRTPPNGFIIVAVLWLLGGLATLVSIYAVYVIDTANAFTVHAERLQSEALVLAAIELTAQQLTSTTARSRPTHGSFNRRIGKANTGVTFQTESARIDLNVASKELLTGLFTSLSENPDRAAAYADHIVRWRTLGKEQNSTLAGQASDVDTISLRAARFFHVHEILLVPGLPTALAEAALPLVTVYSGRQQVNIFEAPPDVLAALPGMTKDRLNALLAQRQILTDDKALSELLGTTRSYVTTESGNAFRLTIHVAYDNGRQANSQVVIVPFDEGPEPYAILSWQDQLDSPSREGLRAVSQ
jgi:general secretion pathway protein K